MNAKRRKKIQEIVAQLNICSNDLSLVRDDEDYSRENIPENLQGGQAYCYSEECSDKLEDALSDVQEAINALEDI